MSENNNQEAKPVTIQPFSVDRNSISFPFVEHTISRGDDKGKPYPAPDINTSNIMEYCKWVGADALVGILHSFSKRLAQGWMDEATDDTGEFNENKFRLSAAAFSVIGESKKVLVERRDALLADLQKLDPVKVMSTPDGSPEKVAFLDLAKRIQEVTAAIDNKRRERKEEEPVSSV